MPEIQNINKIMTNKEIVSYCALQAGGHRFDSGIAHTNNQPVIYIFSYSWFFICKQFTQLLPFISGFRLFFQREKWNDYISLQVRNPESGIQYPQNRI